MMKSKRRIIGLIITMISVLPSVFTLRKSITFERLANIAPSKGEEMTRINLLKALPEILFITAVGLICATYETIIGNFNRVGLIGYCLVAALIIITLLGIFLPSKWADK